MSDPIITIKDIEKIAGLASLDLDQQEKQQFVKQFEEILGYFKKLEGAPTAELSDHPVDDSSHLRPDTAEHSDVSPGQFSPYLEDGYFKVPKVIE
ncbi:MAG: Asp-tRNA(Asn)/Glu-tRNA(Gln) amidotransferase subunit GatC [Deltaproteobacteria bacterium]|nr:Asp-tRNA(Asn)/Glu-tRNA(Gln) amidotransferase subunit GatC [Deltaproteobacteria bacterium]